MKLFLLEEQDHSRTVTGENFFEELKRLVPN